MPDSAWSVMLYHSNPHEWPWVQDHRLRKNSFRDKAWFWWATLFWDNSYWTKYFISQSLCLHFIPHLTLDLLEIRRFFCSAYNLECESNLKSKTLDTISRFATICYQVDNLIPYGHVRKCVKLSFFYLTIFIRKRFASKLFRQMVGIPMGINYVLLVGNSFLFCFE